MGTIQRRCPRRSGEEPQLAALPRPRATSLFPSSAPPLARGSGAHRCHVERTLQLPLIYPILRLHTAIYYPSRSRRYAAFAFYPQRRAYPIHAIHPIAFISLIAAPTLCNRDISRTPLTPAQTSLLIIGHPASSASTYIMCQRVIPAPSLPKME